MAPDTKTLKAIFNLRSNKDFEIVVAWLKKEYDKALRDSILQESDVRARWVQGQAQMLDMILREIDNAEKTLLANKAMKEVEDRSFVA